MTYELRECAENPFCEDLYRINDDGTETFLGSDCGEPEDNLFSRNWNWVLPELTRLAETIYKLQAAIILERGTPFFNPMWMIPMNPDLPAGQIGCADCAGYGKFETTCQSCKGTGIFKLDRSK